MLKLDLHIHTNYSEDAIGSIKEIISSLQKKGLDGMAITDHNTIDGIKKALKIAMEKIPPKYQLALILRYQQDLSYQEIGSILDIAPSSVGSFLLRGRKILRKTILQMEENQ